MKYLYNYSVKSETDRRTLKGPGKIEFNNLHDHIRMLRIQTPFRQKYVTAY